MLYVIFPGYIGENLNLLMTCKPFQASTYCAYYLLIQLMILFARLFCSHLFTFISANARPILVHLGRNIGNAIMHLKTPRRCSPPSLF